ncbi:acyltransferase family protein [Dyadobacter sp. BHUBP1]|uniref:acyltransferase family protein n=1 Tax=Dyadobacter sp. BHUBP1 TaxID=3424178 RepID=UPI003D351552
MERNANLDIAKLSLSFLVIAVHLPLYSGASEDSAYMIGWLFSNGISRIAVPCFFMINGYFVNLTDKTKVKKYMTHLLILYAVWMLLYLPAYYQSVVGNPKYLVKLIVFGFHHLWYVISLIFATIFLYLIKRYLPVSQRMLMVLVIGLFIVGYVIQDVVAPRFKQPQHYVVMYRNFLFFGLPFFAFGHIIRNTHFELDARARRNCYIAILIGTVTLLIESYLSLKYKLGVNLYISLLFLCPPIMILLFKSKWRKSDSLVADIANAVFFTHTGVILFLQDYFGGMPNVYLFPMAVCLSIIVSYVVYTLNRRLKFLL